ncbi:MAG: carboxypeptidase regulatory-like domain-containing protein [Acutalibacteraceae bacterium]
MDSQEEAQAIAGATVDLNGSRKRTDSSGAAEFQLFDGTYPVKVKASGFKPASGTVTVKGAAATLSVNLIES